MFIYAYIYKNYLQILQTSYKKKISHNNTLKYII